MTLPTSVPTTTTAANNRVNNNNNEDDSDIFGPLHSLSSSSSIITTTTTTLSSSPGSGGSVLSISSSSSSSYYHHRSRVPMISPKLRLREERKRILQLCAHKLERIKDSETNLRRSVCINNTYSRLTDELRREKQNRCHLAAATVNNLSKYNADDSKMSRENIFSNTTEQNVELCNDYFYHNRISHNNLSSFEQQQQQQQQYNLINNFSSSSLPNNNKPNNKCSISTLETISQSPVTPFTQQELLTKQQPTAADIFQNSSLSEQSNQNNFNYDKTNSSTSSYLSTTMTFSSSSPCSLSSSSSAYSSTLSSCMSSDNNNKLSSITNNNNVAANMNSSSYNHNNNNNNTINSNNNNCCSLVDTDDLDILDRELNAINASMPLIDPEITQGAEQLEKAISSRKRRSHSIDDENDRLVREALSQFYLPTQRLISEIDDCPFDIKRTKLSSNNLTSHIHHHHNYNNNIINSSSFCNTNLMTTTDFDLELNFDYNQTQKDFEVIIDALRLGTNCSSTSSTMSSSSSSTTATTANDSCGQAAMMSESGVFHNLVVASLET